MRRLAAQRRDERCCCALSGVAVRQSGDQALAAEALDESDRGAAIASANDQVAFPMAGLRTPPRDRATAADRFEIA